MGWNRRTVFPLIIITTAGAFTGLFVYSTPAPAPGSLIASIAATGGTDIAGNAYLAGIASYGASLVGRLIGASLAFSSQAVGTQITGPAQLVLTDTSFASVSALLTVESPATGGNVASVLLFSQSADLSLSARIELEAAQTLIATGFVAAVTKAQLEVQGVIAPTDPAIEIVPNAAGDHIIGTRLSTDADDRWQVDGNGNINWGSGAAVTDSQLHRLLANSMSFKTCDLSVETLGRGLRVREGANCKQGTATLAGGTILVADTAVTATSRIFLTAQDNNSTGALRVSARVAATSFTITSSNAADTGVVAYEIFEPA